MAFINKPYQEIIDDALVKIRGGIVNESHTFVTGEDHYVLDQAPIDSIIAVRGTRNGEPYTFSQGETLDFRLSGENSIEWIGNESAIPDPNTEFFVSYLPQHRDSPITDINIGSVNRTLIEAFSWEVAVLYHQLNNVYENAFIDTAKGKSLDFLVKLLDITRIEAGFALGEVTFSRNTPAPADITIPEGTLVSGISTDDTGAEITHVYKTTEDGTLRRKETSVTIPVRAEIKGISTAAGVLNTMPKPILGIEEVTNRNDTVLGSQEETDEQLRDRAKSRIKGTSTVTREAILTSMLEKDFVTSADVIDRPNNNNGEITVVLDTNRPEVEREVKDQLNAIKAAGVFFDLVFTKKVFPTYSLTLISSTELSDNDKQEITNELREGIKSYLVGLSPAATVVASKIISIAMGIPKVEAAEITDVSVEFEEGSDRGDVRLLPNNDLLIGKFHKATTDEENDPVKLTFKSIAIPEVSAPTVEVPTQELNVEAHIYIKIYDLSLNDLRTKLAIEASVRSYLSNLFAEDGDMIDFKNFISIIKTLKYILKRKYHQNKDYYVGKYIIKVADSVSYPRSVDEIVGLPSSEDIVSLEQDINNYTFLRLVHSADGLERILLSKSHQEAIRLGEVITDPQIFIYVERVS